MSEKSQSQLDAASRALFENRTKRAETKLKIHPERKMGRHVAMATVVELRGYRTRNVIPLHQPADQPPDLQEQTEAYIAELGQKANAARAVKPIHDALVAAGYSDDAVEIVKVCISALESGEVHFVSEIQQKALELLYESHPDVHESFTSAFSPTSIQGD